MIMMNALIYQKEREAAIFIATTNIRCYDFAES